MRPYRAFRTPARTPARTVHLSVPLASQAVPSLVNVRVVCYEGGHIVICGVPMSRLPVRALLALFIAAATLLAAGWFALQPAPDPSWGMAGTGRGFTLVFCVFPLLGLSLLLGLRGGFLLLPAAAQGPIRQAGRWIGVIGAGLAGCGCLALGARAALGAGEPGGGTGAGLLLFGVVLVAAALRAGTARR